MSWKARHAEAERLHESAQDQIASVSSERDALLQEKTSLEKEVATGQTALAELQQKLTQTVSELNASVRALQQTQVELKGAQRRADEAEQAQSTLQSEGITLMHSLEEMRPKIVELTDAKLDLGEKIESLTRSLRARDDTIAQMESEIEELREQHANAETKRRELDTTLEKERVSSQASTTELHQSHSELQKELDELRISSRSLEEERAEYRQLANRHLQDVERLTASGQITADQLSSLRRVVEEQKQAHKEVQDVLERAHEELETLRAEVVAKDEQIEQLQANVTSDSSGSGALGEEILSALKQQHSLEISEAQSEIRALETAVYEAESRTITLQRQLAALETQLSRPNSRSSPRPSLQGRGTSTRTIVDQSDDLRRASFGSARNANGNASRPSTQPSAFEGLSAETRHKRRVSLGMLKARIDSEAAAFLGTPLQKTSALPTVTEPSSSSPSPAHPNGAHPPQTSQRTTVYLDDSHIFWCHACKGDLVIL